MLTDKNIRPDEVNQIGSFGTISMIHHIEKGNRMKPSDSLSMLSAKKLDSIVLLSRAPKVQRKFEVQDAALNHKLQEDILAVMGEVKRTNKIDKVKSTPLMDSIIKSHDQRFALCLVDTGFGRKKGNYGKQIAKGIGVGILTMGAYTPVPYKANTTLYAMIVDAQKSSVIFYNFLTIEKSPVDKNNLSTMYNTIFQDYFSKDNR